MSQAATVLATGLPSPRSKTVRRLVIEDDEVQQIPAIDDSFRESRGSFEQLCESIPAAADGELSVDVTIDPDVICEYVEGSPVLTKLNLDDPTEEHVTRSGSMSKDVSITSGESVSGRSSSFADSPRGSEPQVVGHPEAETPETQKQDAQKPVAQRKSPRGSISHFVYSPEQFEAINKEAVVKFNLKPSDARRYLIDQNIISDDPVDFALWISSTPRLSKRRIGEFIGKENDLNQQCCAALFASYDLQGSLDMALRQLMRQFRLPGEAQQIDRILQQFADQYAQQNPDSAFSSETVYVLAFSVILLNTDLHNPSIPPHKKMTLEQFISNNRGIHDGRDIDRDYLVGLYERVQQQEIRMDEQDMWESEIVTFMAPILSGWLSKKSDGLLGPWKTHWFVLTDGCLYYFLSPKDETPRCIIPLDNTRVNRGNYATDIVITPATGDIVKSSKLVQRSTMEQGRRAQFLLRARSRDDREAWVSALQVESERFRPLHDLFLRVQRQKQTSGELRVALPDSVAEGWMRKRGEINKGWKRRYFVLYPAHDGISAVLYYYVNAQLAQRMRETGVETQKGFLTLLNVKSIHVARDRSPTKAVAIELTTDNRVWVFGPDDAFQFTYWLSALSETLTKERLRVSDGETKDPS